MDWLALIGAFGIGSVVTTIIQNWLAERTKVEERRFLERKEAYIGLLEAWRDDDNEGNPEENAFNIGHWVLRCDLVGSEKTRNALEKWQASEPSSDERKQATKLVKSAMRSDLA